MWLSYWKTGVRRTAGAVRRWDAPLMASEYTRNSFTHPLGEHFYIESIVGFAVLTIPT